MEYRLHRHLVVKGFSCIALLALVGCQTNLSTSGSCDNVHGFGETVQIGDQPSKGRAFLYQPSPRHTRLPNESLGVIVKCGYNQQSGFRLFLLCTTDSGGTFRTQDGTLEAWLLRHDNDVWPAPQSEPETPQSVHELPSRWIQMHEPTIDVFRLTQEERSRLSTLFQLKGEVKIAICDRDNVHSLRLELESVGPMPRDDLWMAAQEQVNRAQMEYLQRKDDSDVNYYTSRLETLKRLRDRQQRALPHAARIKLQYRPWNGPTNFGTYWQEFYGR